MGRVRTKFQDKGGTASSSQLSLKANDLPAPSTLDNLRSAPWLVPRDQPLELVFFQKVYVRLLRNMSTRPQKFQKQSMTAFTKAMDNRDAIRPDVMVPLIELQRAMSRLFRILAIDRDFDARRYDLNNDGCIGWWEFCVIWNQERTSIQLTTMERIFLTFEDSTSSRLGKLASFSVLLAIVVSASSFILSTMPEWQDHSGPGEPKPLPEFAIIDTVCVILFTIEYLVRLVSSAFMRAELVNQDDLILSICADESTPRPSKLRRAFDFALAWPNLIDLAAILPSYIAWLLEAMVEEGDTQPQWQIAVVKLTRLMRVVRAFRLGRRFEAVIIVARSMKRSLRALWVLVLNVGMGMLIFGSMMYFLEHGTYDAESRVYVRSPGGSFEDYYNQTPFQSIPHAFWWALVTAATVGYGDVYPTTPAGKVVASFAMVWSLCVLALPIGVIGSNFEIVWAEYDREKLEERLLKAKTAEMSQATLLSLDPLMYSRKIHFEVYHDSCMSGNHNDIFLGQAEVELQIYQHLTGKVERTCVLPLRSNPARSSLKAKGELTIEYCWAPDVACEDSDENGELGTLLKGNLTVNVVSASGLADVDWKPLGIPDPYVRVSAYPESPGEDGKIAPRVAQTSTIFNHRLPSWQQTLRYRYNWHSAGVKAKQELERRLMLRACTKPEEHPLFNVLGSAEVIQPSTPLSPPERPTAGARQDEEGSLINTLAGLRADITALRSALPQLRSEVGQLQHGAKLILVRLQNAGQLPFLGSSNAGAYPPGVLTPGQD